MSDSTAIRKLNPVPFNRVRISDGFWAPRMTVNREQTLPAQYKQLCETGRIDAFLLRWKPGEEPKPHIFWDSDVAKWIEAASYSLTTHPDPELDRLLDEVIGKIAGAQQEDGYLNVFFTIVEPENRFKFLSWAHELYCAGHLMEAAVAHFQATGKRSLLDVMTRYADHIDSVFGPGKRSGAPGHEEVELALYKLHKVTGEERYLNLSRFFINQRGQTPSVFDIEKQDGNLQHPQREYYQDHLPAREQSEAVGHAVRATYLYSAMADVAGETGDAELLRACERLWDDLTLKKMYVTGGIGSTRDNEGFTSAYDLPNDTAYAETCAAIGLVFWAWRMLQFSGDARYADVMERALYNGTISGVSLDGTGFFYVNPLESNGSHHRQDWFGCACCPPNIARLLASLGGYVYSESDTDLYVHLYVQGEATVRVAGQEMRVVQETKYPWDGAVRVKVTPQRAARFGLNLRIPGWCTGARLKVDGEDVDMVGLVRKGYVRLEREWTGGEVVELTLAMPVQRLEAYPSVRHDRGRVALQRGPIVYCLEQTDNSAPLWQVSLPRAVALDAGFEPGLLGGVVVVTAEALVDEEKGWDGQLYRLADARTAPCRITAVPYCVWDNREAGQMLVWVRSV